jgi:hypothetical protein
MTDSLFLVWLGLAIAFLSVGLWSAGLLRQRPAFITAAIGLVGAALFAFAPATLAAII